MAKLYLALVGGANEPQSALNTLGSTTPESFDVTGVDGLGDLEAGRSYNISGPNILPGSTFVAPAASDTLTMDQPATGLGTDVPLMFVGPIVENEPFDPSLHQREDQEVLTLQIDQRESDCASVTITIPNPRVGLLSPTRQQWCWVSDDDGPLLNGRLYGVFEDLSGETVRLKFMAKPKDYTARKLALATSMAVLPFYDPVFQSAQPGSALQPDAVLEGYSALLHVDRVDLSVSASDVLEGEAGTISFGPDQVLYDISVRMGQAPLLQCDVDATVGWTQHGNGTVDLTSQLIGAFAAAGSCGYKGGNWIASLTGDGLYSAWPKPGASLGNGWTLSMDSQITPATFAPQDRFTPGYEDAGQLTSQPLVQPVKFIVTYLTKRFNPFQDPATAGLFGGVAVAQDGGDGFTSAVYDPNSWFTQVAAPFPVWAYRVDRFAGDYVAGRKRTEQIRFSVLADIQAVDPSGSEPAKVSVTSDQVGEAIDAGFTIPIGDTRRNFYFATDRGVESEKYLALLAIAKLRSRARAVEVEFTVPWSVGRDITCRHSATITDDRIPGGTATGKVIAYSLMSDPGGGQRAKITIGCAIGHGGSVEAAAGTGAWAEEDVVEPDVQVLVGEQISLASGALWIESPRDFAITDSDGINLLDLQSSAANIAAFTVENGLRAQISAAGSAAVTAFKKDPIATVKDMPTKVTAQFVDIGGGSFHADLTPGVSPLKIPKGIDLEAV